MPEEWNRCDAGNDDRTGGEVDDPWAAHDPPERSGVVACKPGNDRRFATLTRLLGGEQKGQRRRHRERHDHRRAERGEEGDDDRREEGAGHALEEEQRDDRHGNDQSPVQSGSSYLERRIEDDGRRRARIARPALTQPPGDVLGADDRFVGDENERRHESRQDQRVHRLSECVQDECSGDEG